MKVTSLIYRKLSQADFKNISGQGGVEGGGGQGYIDISANSISVEQMFSFLGDKTSDAANGPRWKIKVRSLSLDNSEQEIIIYQRRKTSFCIASQKVGTSESNRVNVWKSETTNFPDKTYNEKDNPLVVFILKDTEGIFWAGWFYVNEGLRFVMNSSTAEMFVKDDGYIIFSEPMVSSTRNYKWPFLFNVKLRNCVNHKTAKTNISQYLSALRTKPFMLLAGISGTGKSRIVREFAFKSCPDYLQDKDGTTPGNYCMVEVKPNWHDSTELLGYWSNINKRYMFTKFVKFLVKAKMFPEVPFFVCLDEMNLAPVEQYFAEFLSVLETRRLIKNDKGEDEVVSGVLVDKEYFAKLGTLNSTSGTVGTLKTDRDIYFKLFDIQDKEEMEKVKNDSDSLLTEGLTLPENVFIVGTVNMDDTTHQFSRKVIDRAMTIEMNGGALADIFKNNSDLTYSEEPMTMEDMKSKYISAAEVLEKCYSVVNSQEISDYIQGNGEEGVPQRLEEINKVLRGTPFTVSYRVMNELTIYLAVLLDKAVEDGMEVTADNFKPYIEEAIDKILLMKILPRVEGDDEMFRISDDERNQYRLDNQVDENGTSHEYTKLDWLREIAPQHTAENEQKYMAVDKLKEMIGRLNRQSFTRYWP